MSKNNLSIPPKTPTSLTASAAKAALSGEGQGAPAVENQVPRGRRSALSEIRQACTRRIETLVPSAKRLARKNAVLKAENDDLRADFLTAKNRDFNRAKNSEDGWLQRLLPKALRLREDNKRLAQENADIDLHLQVRTTIGTADEKLSNVLAAMIQGNAALVATHGTFLVQAIDSVKKGKVFGPFSAIDVYTDRLPIRLEHVSTPRLKAIGMVPPNLVGQQQDAVEERVRFAVAAELLRRENPSQIQYAAISRPELVTIRDCCKKLLEHAERCRLVIEESGEIVGTHFKRADLENFEYRALRGIHSRIVQDTLPNAWSTMSAADRREVAEAVDFFNKASTLSSADFRKKLSALAALVKKDGPKALS